MIDPEITETRRAVDTLIARIQEFPENSPEQLFWFRVLGEYLWLK